MKLYSCLSEQYYPGKRATIPTNTVFGFLRQNKSDTKCHEYTRAILRDIVGLSRVEFKIWIFFNVRHTPKNKCIFLVFSSVKFFITLHTRITSQGAYNI